MTKSIVHPIYGTISYKEGDLYKEVFSKFKLLPYEFRLLVKYHEEREIRVKADNYATKGLRTKDMNEYQNELLIIDFWRQISEIRLDRHGRIM